MKRILLTGGGRGLGLAICRDLLSQGYTLVTCSRKVSPELSLLIQQWPKQLDHHSIDLADSEAVRKFVSAARLLEGLAGFVSNAGIGTAGLLTLTSEASLRECVEVNLIAPMLLARQAIKAMIDGGGSLIFISSVAAQVGMKGLSAYAATKGALVSFSRSVAREYGERGIRSNCILPGFLETEMTDSLEPDQRNQLVRRTALKRLGSPEDVVGVVSFLLSDAARYVTGTEIVVDGGMTA